MAALDSFLDLLGQGANLYSQYQGSQGYQNANNAIQQSLGQNQQTIQDQINMMQGGLGNLGQISQDQYNTARDQFATQNQQLQGNIDTMTGNLNALSDPNSPYMQMARERISRADAAAGRRSQVGEREVQLAALLADYVGKYAPGLNNSISAARNQMATNNATLGTLSSALANSQTSRQQALNQLLQQQQANAQRQLDTARPASQGANNQNNATLQAGLGAAGSLANLLGSLFGGSSGGGGSPGLSGSEYNYGGSSYNPSVDAGITGWMNSPDYGSQMWNADNSSNANYFGGTSGNLWDSGGGDFGSLFSDNLWN